MKPTEVLAASALVLSSLAMAASPAPPPAGKAPAVPQPPKQAVVGEVFEGGVFDNVNPAGGPLKIDLRDVIGRKPIVLCYLKPGIGRAEQVFLELQKAAEEAGLQKLLLYGVVPEETDREQARTRLAELKVRVPVLRDTGYRLLTQLGILRLPSIAVLDAGGRLRLAHGASLRQTLEYKLDLEAALRRLAGSGEIGTYGILPPYYPAVEMVGKKVPDFEAAVLGEGKNRRWSSLLDPSRLNVLVFWSVDCPHCRESLPQINDWLKQHPGQVNLVSAARVGSEAERVKTEEFIKAKGFLFPTLADENFKIADALMVTATPTMMILRADGTVDTVLLSGDPSFARMFEEKRKELARSAG